MRAVLVASGSTLPLDGVGEMSTAVHVDGDRIVCGPAAWRQAAAAPDGFVLSPLRAGTGKVTVAGAEMEVADLVIATLRLVVDAARQAAGEPVDEVRLVVPAGWGPRRRNWLRHAARTAGLPLSSLVEVPIAALAAPGSTATAAAGRPVLVLDVGAGCEVSVVQHSPAGGAEVLSTLTDLDAGGDRIDAALLHALTGTDLDELTAAHRWTVLAGVRAARHALAEQVAVTLPMPDGRPAAVVDAAQADHAARPVFERVAQLAVQALSNADLALEQISGILLIGAAARTPGAADMIAAKLGAPVDLQPLPQVAAVLGAAGADTTGAPGADEDPLRLPPLRRLITLMLPGVASLALYAHFVLSADFNLGTPALPRAGYYVLANWGELSVAAVLATLTCLQAAALFAVLLGRHTGTAMPPAGRIGVGIGLAVAAGLATDALYAITAAVFFNQPTSGLLRWALLPVLPTVAATAGVAVPARRRAVAPVGGWDAALTFPASSMIAAAVGIFGVCLWWQGRLPWWLEGWVTSLGLAGGLLIGIAVACALVRHPLGRLALGVPMGFFTAIISRTGPDIVAIMWAISVAGWWTWRAWLLARPAPAWR